MDELTDLTNYFKEISRVPRVRGTREEVVYKCVKCVKCVKTYLLLDLVETEGLGGDIIEQERILLASIARQRALLRRDLLGIVERVLIVHAVVAEGDGLHRAPALDAEEVQGDGLGGVRGVHHLDDDLTRARVEDGRGEEAVLTCLSGHGLLVHRER